jgi:hypothetical protein
MQAGVVDGQFGRFHIGNSRALAMISSPKRSI